MKKLSVIGLCIILAACGSTNVKESPPAVMSAEQHIQAAQQAMDAWAKQYDPANLWQAELHFQEALQAFPNNVLLQKAHYRAAYMRAVFTGGDQAKLLKIYKQLHPLVQREVDSPAKLNYVKALSQKAEPEQKIQALKLALMEQPANVHTWLRLAEEFNQLELYWLSSYAAKRALELNDQSPEAQFKLGHALLELAHQHDCYFEQKPLLKRAAKLMAKAAAKDPQLDYLDFSSRAYGSLGLTPLAYQQAKKAFEHTQDPWTSLHLAQTSELMGRNQEVEPLANYLLQNSEFALEGYELLARLALSQGEWQLAYQNAQLFQQNMGQDILTVARSQWAGLLAGALSREQVRQQLEQASSEGEWLTKVKGYLLAEGADHKQFIASAQNTCERTEAYFYQGFKYWLEHQPDASKRALLASQKESANVYYEYLWAKALLKAPLP